MSPPPAQEERRRAVLAARAARLAARNPHGARGARQEPCVFCTFARQHLAIPAERVRFVAPAPPITVLPGLPPWFVGVAAPRGQLISVVDPRGLMGQPSATSTVGGFLVVLQGPAGALGLLVEALAGFGEPILDELRPAPFEGGLPLKGVWDDGAALLDVTALLDDPRMIVGAGAGTLGSAAPPMMPGRGR